MSHQRLFISHASEDEAAVARIVDYLEAQGVTCWIAGRDIPPRAIYAEAITQGIQECDACVVIVSHAANASAAIKRELELASHYGKSFIPIRIDSAEPGPGLDYYLRNTQWIQYAREGERALDRIAANVSGGATPRPAAPRQAPTPSRRRQPALLIALALAVIVAAGAWFAWDRLTPDPAQTATAESAAPPPQAETAEDTQRREAETAALARERDDAAAAARRQLAEEQARRENAERLQRENAERQAVQRQEANERAQREAAEQAQREAAARAQANTSALGRWWIEFVWDDGRTGAANITFREGGAFATTDGYRGTWSQTGATVSFRFTTGARYSGRISGETARGAGHTSDGINGDFEMTRD